MSWQLFDRVRAYTRSINLFRHENLLQNQDDLTRVSQGGQFINFSTQGLVNQTNLHINRLERYKDFDQMDQVGEITMALDIYADEATQIDPESKHTLFIRAKNKKVKEELEHLFFDTLNIDHKLRPFVRYLCKYGDTAIEIIPSKNRDAVSSIRPFNIFNFVRVETRFGDLVGFYFSEQMAEAIFLHPWQVVHMRLASLEDAFRPYGKALLDGARKDFKRLRLMEDAALVYRVSRASLRRVFTIPVGNIPAHEVTNYLNQIADQFKRHRFFDPATGDVNWRYAPLIQEDDFWMPQRSDGTGPTVTNLPGAENLDQIADIVYFKKKMISALKIPFDKVGLAEGNTSNDKTLSSQNTDFAKAVQWVQMETAVGLKKIALVHLALRGYAEEDMSNFDVGLTSSSAIDELYRIETWQSRANVIGSLKDTALFPDRWILEHFTDMTDDEIQEIELQAPMPGELGELGELGGETALEAESRLNKKLARDVIVEYESMRDGLTSTRKIDLDYHSVFESMAADNEFIGLPLGKNKTDNLLLAHDDNVDPFVLVEDHDTNDEHSGVVTPADLAILAEEFEDMKEIEEVLIENQKAMSRVPPEVDDVNTMVSTRKI